MGEFVEFPNRTYISAYEEDRNVCGSIPTPYLIAAARANAPPPADAPRRDSPPKPRDAPVERDRFLDPSVAVVETNTMYAIVKSEK